MWLSPAMANEGSFHGKSSAHHQRQDAATESRAVRVAVQTRLLSPRQPLSLDRVPHLAFVPCHCVYAILSCHPQSGKAEPHHTHGRRITVTLQPTPSSTLVANLPSDYSRCCHHLHPHAFSPSHHSSHLPPPTPFSVLLTSHPFPSIPYHSPHTTIPYLPPTVDPRRAATTA